MSKPFEISKRQVWEAWKCVKLNRGSAGIDDQSIADFESDLSTNLYKLWNRMSSGTYFPPPVLGVDIPKSNGGKRRLGIPAVCDRVAQTVVKMKLEPKLEEVFLPDSYGYRPGKSAHDAVAVTRRRCWRKDWVLEFDIKGLFDNLSWDLLMKALRHHTACKWSLLYVERWLQAPMVLQDGKRVERSQGTPQGGVISPLLANLFMHYCFDYWISESYPGVEWCRYADDGLLHCRSKREAENLLAKLRDRLKECGLELHPSKTKIVYCRDSQRKAKEKVNEFDFLGFGFRTRLAVNSRDGRKFQTFSPAMSRSALKKTVWMIKHKWRLQSKVHLSLAQIANWINPIVRGLAGYYTKFGGTEFRSVARYINDRLRIWAQRKFSNLRGKRTRAFSLIERISEENPNLFVHWRFMKVR